MGDQSPSVRFEPCDTWIAGSDAASAACGECGWFEEDHWLADLEGRPHLADVEGRRHLADVERRPEPAGTAAA